MSHTTERYIVVIDQDAAGRRTAARHPLNMPIALATAVQADGSFDLSSPAISNRAISDLKHDLLHELARRHGRLHELGGWDPNAPSRAKARLSERDPNTTTEEDTPYERT